MQQQVYPTVPILAQRDKYVALGGADLAHDLVGPAKSKSSFSGELIGALIRLSTSDA